MFHFIRSCTLSLCFCCLMALSGMNASAAPVSIAVQVTPNPVLTGIGGYFGQSFIRFDDGSSDIINIGDTLNGT